MKITEAFGQTHELGTKAVRPCTLVALAACLASSQQQHSAPAAIACTAQVCTALHACLRCVACMSWILAGAIIFPSNPTKSAWWQGRSCALFAM